VLAVRPAYNIGYVAYFELNIDYIIEKYCINKEKPQLNCKGKCHLMSKLDVSTQNDTKPSYALITNSFFPVYFQTDTNGFHRFIQKNIRKNNWIYSNLFASIYLGTIDRPPQV